jgi:ATP-binding cassette, subfamily B, bacterial PglK
MISKGGLEQGAIGEILPMIGLYAFAAYRIKPAIHGIYSGFSSLKFGKPSVDKIHNDIKKHGDVILHKENIPKLDNNKCLSLQNLNYAYPGSDKHALFDININIPFGTSVGIIGGTGAGKTTLVDIILGLLSPIEGSIKISGKKLYSDNIKSWQKSLGYVPQDIYLNDATISENIALGIPLNEIDNVQVHECAKIAQIHNFIDKELPMKYNTKVGERGVRLSGGQRQRIGIARALYRNPKVLVFDEATSALDAETERAVIKAINLLNQCKTMIFITHRLSTVKDCDQIINLEDGKVVHKDLKYSDFTKARSNI